MLTTVKPAFNSYKYGPSCVGPDFPGQSGEARIFLIQDDNLTAEVPLRRSILQSTLRQKYRSTGRHNPQRDGGPEKGLYRLHPIALPRCPMSRPSWTRRPAASP